MMDDWYNISNNKLIDNKLIGIAYFIYLIS